ncbi:hypothetical protein [Rubritalea halochordaticola]
MCRQVLWTNPASNMIMKSLPIIALLLCTPALHAEPLTKAEVLRHSSADSDLAYWGNYNGINFPKLMENCLNHRNQRDQTNAWKILVHFLHSCGADGAAGDTLSLVGPGAAALVEDDRLVHILSQIPRDHWQNIPFDPVHRFGYDKLSEQEKEQLKKEQPLLHALIADTLLRRNDYAAWKAANDKRQAQIKALTNP